MASRIRIDSNEDVVTDAKVIYVSPDGVETDISQACNGIEISLQLGQPASATLHMIKVEGHVSAELTNVVLKEFKPRKWGRLRSFVHFGGNGATWWVRA